MEYRLLNDGCGVILTRQPEIIEGELRITFSGAPKGAVAVFTCSGTSYYRDLSEGECTIPVTIICGEISVRVIHYNGSVKPPTWRCEGILATNTAAGIFVAPDDRELPLEIAKIKLAHHELREEYNRLELKYQLLQETFASMMEGYDLT